MSEYLFLINLNLILLFVSIYQESQFFYFFSKKYFVGNLGLMVGDTFKVSPTIKPFFTANVLSKKYLHFSGWF